MVFAMQKPLFPIGFTIGFDGDVKKDNFLNLSTVSPFLRNDKIILGNKIQENVAW